MPNAIRGDVYDYDYGPIVGNELSHSRRALVISRNDLHDQLRVAISLPTSENGPKDIHIDKHVEIIGAGSWASVRQIKSVDKARLGTRRGSATPQELEKILETLIGRLANLQCAPGIITTKSGPQQIAEGTVWNADLGDPDEPADGKPVKAPLRAHVLILDYNKGNDIAIVAEIEYRRRPNSPYRVPITVTHTNQASTPASALVHRIRSIDVSARTMEKIGSVDQNDISTVNGALLAALDPNQKWPPRASTRGHST